MEYDSLWSNKPVMLKPVPVKTFSLCILFLVISGLLSAQVSRHADTHSVCGRSFQDAVNTPQVKESGDRRPRSRLPCDVTDMAGFASLNAHELFDYITSVDDPIHCINRIIYTFHTEYSKDVFSDSKVRLVAERSTIIASNYDGQNDNGVFGAFVYMSIAGLQATFYPDDISLSESTWQSLKSACQSLSKNPNILSESQTSLLTLGHMLFTASFDDIAADRDVLQLAKQLLDNIAADSYVGQTDLYSYYYCYYYLLDVFFRYPVDSSAYLSEIVIQQDIITSLGDVATNLELNSDTYQFFGDLSTLSVVAVSRHASHEPLRPVVSSSLRRITETYDEFSPKWINAAVSLARNDLGFDRTESELTSELELLAFPNNYHFEDGLIQIATSLDYGEAIGLYQSALEVRAQFFRMLEAETPVPQDVNDTLYIKIYNDRTSYRDYNDILYGVNFPNSGGVYIEAFGTFYTYDRTPEESAYSLEELFRHEYTHYLQGRYLVPGGWGQDPYYNNSRLVWFEEGMAQFFSGATRTDGVKALDLIRNTIVNDSSKDGLEKILNSSYSTGDPDAYYIYGAMLWTYWYEKDRGRFQEMLQLLRNEDVTSFDNIVDFYKQSIVEEERFFGFIDSIITEDDSWIIQETSRMLPNDISFSSLDSIKKEIRHILPDLEIVNCEIEASEDPRQFRISGNVIVTQGTNTTQSALNINESLDEMLIQLSASQLNNFDYTTAHYDNIFTGSGSSAIGAEFHIYGPINDECDPVPITDFTSESLDNQVRLHVPEYVHLRHQFRYRLAGTTQWRVILANVVSPDVIFNLGEDMTYEFQMRQECVPDVWSEYSESKFFMLCPDERMLSGRLESNASYQAGIAISTSQVIADGASVIYEASQEIEFNQEFTIEVGGALEVNNNNCQDPQ